MIQKLNHERVGWEASAGLIAKLGIPVEVYSLLTALLLVGPVTMAAAQESAREDRTSSGEVPTCTSLSSASRTRTQACDEGPTIILDTENELTFTVDLPSPVIGARCETDIDLEYTQWDTIARVSGTIEGDACTASSGRYEVQIRVVDENDETRTLAFSESWQRDDDQPVLFSADYPIGENVELMSLRAGKVNCTCVDAIEE